MTEKNATTAVEKEHVLVVPTELFHQCGKFQGFTPNINGYLPTLLDSGHTTYQPRGEMETDPSFKQLIPYCIFRHIDIDGDSSLFQYTRGNRQGESRLHAQRSIGIGGHISTLDAGEESPYEIGMNRELDEEVSINCPFEQRCVGLINDDSNEVGRVHLGVVHIFDVESTDVVARESGLVDAGFEPVSQLQDAMEEFETWSQICLRAIFQ